MDAVIARVASEDEQTHMERADAEVQVGYDNLARAAENDAQLAEWLARFALEQHPGSWPAAFSTSLRQGGAVRAPRSKASPTPQKAAGG